MLMSPQDSRRDTVKDGGGKAVSPLNLGRPACFPPPPALIVESRAHPPETRTYWLLVEKPVGGAGAG